MCGLIYGHSFLGKPVNNYILDQFDQQRHRGTEGFGLFNGQHLVRAATEDKILNWLVKDKNDSSLIMFHHRYPTSTINTKKACHPMTTRGYFGDSEYILIHNGHVSNAETLYEAHSGLGIEYQTVLPDLTFNDSEALLWDLALVLEGKQQVTMAMGNIAYICMKLVNGKLDKLYFGRNACLATPLHFYKSGQGIEISSEGRGDLLKDNTLYTWDYKTKKLTKKQLTFGRYAVQTYQQPYQSWEKEEDYLPPYVPPDWARRAMEAKKTDKQAQLQLPSGQPLDTEIETNCMVYLSGAKGHFEQAYWAMEDDYDTLVGRIDTPSNIRDKRLLEMTMAHLSNDPEYLDEESISSIWEAQWVTGKRT